MNLVHVILALSLAGNAALGWAYLHQRDATTTAKVEQRQATGVALECSKGTESLETKAAERHAAAAPKIEQARQQAGAADRRADAILATPPAAPGDVCVSAQALVDDWWAGRAKP